MIGNLSCIKIVLVGEYEIGKNIIEEFIEESNEKFFSLISEESVSISIKNKNYSIYNAGSKIGPYSSIKKFSDDTSAVFMVYDKENEESFMKLKNTLNDVNDYYKNVFKAVIVKNADYKENGQNIANEMEEFNKKCDTALYFKKNKNNFKGLYNLILEIAKKVPKIDEDDKQEEKEGRCCFSCSIF